MGQELRDDSGSSDKPNLKVWPFNRRGSAKLMMIGAFFMIFSSFSVPLWHSEKYTMDVARVDFAGPNLPTIAGVKAATSLSMGIWGYCVWGNNTDNVECQMQMPYSISIIDTTTNQTFLVKSSWTRGLFLHALAAMVITAIPFLLRYDNISYVLCVSLFGNLLGCAAGGFDFMLFSSMKHEMTKTKSDLGARMRIPTAFIFLLIGNYYFGMGVGDYIGKYLMRHQRSTAKDTSSTESQEKQEKQVPLLSSPA